MSLAAGYRANANHSGALVWADQTETDFASTAQNQFLIRASGGVGIGTNTPSGRLHVHDADVNIAAGSNFSNRVAPLVVGRAEAGYGTILIDGNQIEQARTSDRLHINYSSSANITMVYGGGNVGIGTESPSTKLHVVGNICYTGSIGACSDERYKKDVRTIDNALETLLKLRGVTYNWKQDEYRDLKFDDQRHIGFVAQELKGLLPGVVIVDNKGYMSVDYGRLTPLLVEAIKELKAENTELRAKTDRITALETQLNALRATVSQIVEK